MAQQEGGATCLIRLSLGHGRNALNCGHCSLRDEGVSRRTYLHRLSAGQNRRLYAWEFEENGRPFQYRVQGPLVFNDSDLMRQAAIAGLGLAYLYEDDAAEDIRAGRLVRVLEDWCSLLPGDYLYHPSRRQTPPALAALIGALRYRGSKS